ncbi:MAG: tRNA 2-thiouridine(34) synthase MnmA [Bacteroidales bacterium]|nr:tRNA 2-thiouridine(34) synthase MnmA [Bacteroidales bacterium]
MKKIIVGLSGGVDSGVAAYLLKEQGYDVHAVYMINWHDTEGVIEGSCPSDEDILIAQLVARKLDIPFQTVDFSELYAKRVVDYMFSEYEKGRTPNPDVLCNREIKFDVFLDKVLEMGADMVATGHYCRKETIEKDGKQIHRLLAGKDNNKDQSYFLCQLSQKQLEKALFPIGELQKSEVRAIAGKSGLACSHKKDSQGICFVGKVDLPTFLQQKLESKKGDIIKIPTDYNKFSKYENIDMLSFDEQLKILSEPFSYFPESGIKAGEHNGAHFYTIGQRQGLGIGGLKEPPFVIGTDVVKNIVYIGEGKQHPGLFRKGLFISKNEIHWVRPDLEVSPGDSIKILSRIRYRQALQKATLFMRPEGAYLIFDEDQRGITSGQFAAFYIEDELIGSGVIS